jgi:large subunit ribosomal protein L4
MKIDVVTLTADKAGTVDLPDEIFGIAEPRADLLHRYVIWQLAKRRAGTRKTKTRSEVKGANRKIYRQKGTGGARHGNRKVPQFRGGGKAHGPVVRSHEIDLPKKVRRLALRHALSSKAGAGELIVLDEAKMSEPRTRVLAQALGKLGLGSVLVVDGNERDANFYLAARNLPSIDVLPVEGINVYDILRRDKLVLTRAALGELEARLK